MAPAVQAPHVVDVAAGGLAHLLALAELAQADGAGQVVGVLLRLLHQVLVLVGRHHLIYARQLLQLDLLAGAPQQVLPAQHDRQEGQHEEHHDGDEGNQDGHHEVYGEYRVGLALQVQERSVWARAVAWQLHAEYDLGQLPVLLPAQGEYQRAIDLPALLGAPDGQFDHFLRVGWCDLYLAVRLLLLGKQHHI